MQSTRKRRQLARTARSRSDGKQPRQGAGRNLVIKMLLWCGCCWPAPCCSLVVLLPPLSNRPQRFSLVPPPYPSAVSYSSTPASWRIATMSRTVSSAKQPLAVDELVVHPGGAPLQRSNRQRNLELDDVSLSLVLLEQDQAFGRRRSRQRHDERFVRKKLTSLYCGLCSKCGAAVHERGRNGFASCRSCEGMRTQTRRYIFRCLPQTRSFFSFFVESTTFHFLSSCVQPLSYDSMS